VNGLNGIRILSFNHFLMGPLGVQHVADCGAEVMSIEPVDGAFERFVASPQSLMMTEREFSYRRSRTRPGGRFRSAASRSHPVARVTH
jgi:crotonobetainyl-CoA:carnitine CoA-transferase CaiB-like acyl-CoA transferase